MKVVEEFPFVAVLVLLLQGPFSCHGALQAFGPTEKPFFSRDHDKAYAVDGQWTAWAPQTACTKSCGTGTWTVTRTCTRPRPTFEGLPCSVVPNGDTMTQNCNVEPCPVYANRAGWTVKSSGYYNNDNAFTHNRVKDSVRGDAARVYHTPHDGTVDRMPDHYHWIQVDFGVTLQEIAEVLVTKRAGRTNQYQSVELRIGDRAMTHTRRQQIFHNRLIQVFGRPTPELEYKYVIRPKASGRYLTLQCIAYVYMAIDEIEVWTG